MTKIFNSILLILLLFQVSCAGGADKKEGQKIEIDTNFGKMVFLLYDETPQHRDNFIKLAQEGYFDDLLFHRVINHFMIQGGDPQSKNAPSGQRLGNGGPDYTIPAEINLAFFHKKGVLAAARKGDNVNPEKRSSGSQFYIVQGKTFTDAGLDSLEIEMNNRQAQQINQAVFNEHKAELNKLMQAGQRDSFDVRIAEIKELAAQKAAEAAPYKISPEKREVYKTIGGYPSLDGGYTVFGELIEGFDVLDKIAAVETDQFDRPVQNVTMKVKVLK
ncbi:peptidylprolyl isomerase [Mangrovibacterium diazotrophicum]|uniref:Peptidyl-prolyl cis-trans isomerase n=1 Tax=Mangrovibacterium diazotrophicum TaxID=1261403 RepID=A0A419WA32_9BACT|nr:peptidylprolyl isomerase [Mangrovibacterium diazotrophicum]RKD92328.1 peptidyl-prolyl cis-trans isomerase B (cyclophilin B) [Mangrovibacterium diazotrophicum]